MKRDHRLPVRSSSAPKNGRSGLQALMGAAQLSVLALEPLQLLGLLVGHPRPTTGVTSSGRTQVRKVSADRP